MPLWYMRLAQTNRVPDWLIRAVVRRSLARTLQQRYRASLEERTAEKQALIEKLRQSPIAIHTDDPNRQHYEVPSEFFSHCAGQPAEVQLLLLARREHHPGRSRGRDAAPDLSSAPGWRTGWRCWTWVVAGARSACGSPSSTPTAG